MSDKLDESHNVSQNEHFRDVLERSIKNPSRRSVIRGGSAWPRSRASRS